MALSLAEIKQAVADYVGTTDRVTTALINEAQRRTALYTPRQTMEQVDVDADGRFTLPATCLILKGMSWQGRELYPYPDRLPPEIPEGTPRWYLQLDQVIQLLPKQEGVVDILFTPRPRPLENAEDTLGLADADNVVIAIAIQLWFEGEADYEEEALWWKGVADERLAEWAALERQRHFRPTVVNIDVLTKYFGA
jgi:hypothetical protein